ncbi:MAG: sigma-70 family RNA polymerase sigma factor [Mariprofundus sp.]|nr:sigma-70 family RNA polymerase sigma factor [Mariprofundus sp.]
MDPMAIYMREISRYELLDASEEVALSKRIAAGDEEARHFMVHANLRLVVKISRRYANRGVALADLIEEGNLGLIRAVEKFDAAHGCRFSTYATWWIRQSVERAIMNLASTIRIPVHVVKEYKALMSHTNRLRVDLNREPTELEVSITMNISLLRVQELMHIAVKTESVDELLHDGGEFTLHDVVADVLADQPGEKMQQRLRGEMLNKWMEKLSSREREVVRMRYGLMGGECWTLEEVGEQLKLTRERIRQIQVQALHKLRKQVVGENIDFKEII